MERTDDRVSSYALLTLAPLFWSCNWIAGRWLSHDVPPLAMTFWRWFFALVILAPFAWPKLRRDAPLVRRHWKALLALGIIGIGTHNALAYLGLRYTTAVNGVILNSFIPVMIVALSCWPPRRGTRWCSICSFATARDSACCVR